MPTVRKLRDEECELIRSLLSEAPARAALEETLSTSCVADMEDEGMGSIRFVRPEPRSLGKTLAEAQYIDADGVLVSIALNVDQHGNLFEIDFWKTDLSPLRRYPTAPGLSFKHQAR